LVDIQPDIQQAAEILFHSDAVLLKAWQKSMATSLETPNEPVEFWMSLIDFCQSEQLLAIVDWRERLAEVVEQLRSLRSVQSLNLAWDKMACLRLEMEQGLEAVGAAAATQGLTLISLDHDADDYVLTFLPSDIVPFFVATLKPVGFEIDIYK
jgi:hypothetical protein